jgi:hypothetical protein
VPPGYSKAWTSRSLVFLRLGEYDKSIADYDASLKVNAKNAWSLYVRGIDKVREHKAAEGQADMDQVALIWPQVADEFNRRGIAP